jgi:hypothetical protein
MATPNRNESQKGAAGEPEEGSIFDDRDLRRSCGGGKRYAALTHFGLVPAALAGVDLHALLGRARRMAEASGAEREAPTNAGLRLAAVLEALENATAKAAAVRG